MLAPLTVVIASERLLLHRELVVHAVAAVLVMLGITLAPGIALTASPAAVPALTSRNKPAR